MAYKKTPSSVLVWCLFIAVLVVSSEVCKADEDNSMLQAIGECQKVCKRKLAGIDCLHFCLSRCAQRSCEGNFFPIILNH